MPSTVPVSANKKSCMHSFNKYFLITYRVPNTVLSARGKTIKKVLPTFLRILKKLSSSGE